MNEDTTKEPTAMEPSNTDSEEHSLKDFMAKYILTITAIICAPGIGSSVDDLWNLGVGSIVPNLVWWICFGIYPFIMGIALHGQATRKDVSFNDEDLKRMLWGAFLGWIGLILLLVVLKTVLLGDIGAWLVEGVLAPIFGVVLCVAGGVVFMKPLRSGRAVEPLERRDPAEAEQTWIVEETGRQNRKWRMSLFPDAIQLKAESESQLCDVQLIQAPGEIELDTTAGTASIKAPGLKLGAIRLNQDQLAVLKDRIGTPMMQMLKDSLMGWDLFGVFFALILAVDQVWPTPEPNLSIDKLIILLATGLAGIWFIGIALAIHYHPHRMIFLLKSGALAYMAILFGVDMLIEPNRITFTGVCMPVVLAGAAVFSLLDYRRFRGVHYKGDAKPKMHMYLKLTLLGAVIILFLAGVGLIRGT